ncbi:bifunctional nuclease family protein [Venenivibrio stagnispumantis]|uniref:BFN domain-containing protein n=1 Tax=Venenivibrio stagnispumantis TaxID=407998 RepID=A0AA45WJC7_9AQUI|nr:bifunctional nuclease family protein [Venenivibrio stagnispumantis]MCW4572446.1 bifunctional nuclease family protein [Venenivibrio stagnispumantis]SMP02978.1 hypothetical protein SAMN06264868_102108 [Venenivibrio stagnispumantis]
MVEMEVQGITLDPTTNMPIVILKSKEGAKILPIWIGIFEANSIATVLENVQTPRPMTYDLMVNLIDSLSAKVDSIKIHTLQDNTYYASVVIIDRNGTKIEIDSRPSDAINVALRTESPIYVSQQLLEIDNEEKIDEEDIKEWLESLKPEDFEKNIEF